PNRTNDVSVRHAVPGERRCHGATVVAADAVVGNVIRRLCRRTWKAHSLVPVAPNGAAIVCRSVAAVALLFPRVSVHVVAVRFPEARLVVVAELEAAYPLGALPEVQVWDE